MDDIGVIGLAVPGLVLASCLTAMGHTVRGCDERTEWIARLKSGKCPLYEPYLSEMMQKCAFAGKLVFTDDLPETAEECGVLFLTTDLPVRRDGSVDVRPLFRTVLTAAKHIRRKTLMVVCAPSPIGTNEKLRRALAEQVKEGSQRAAIDVVNMPFFLRPGSMIYDFLHPEFLVFGGRSEDSREILHTIFSAFEHRGCPFLYCDSATSEMLKYISNAILANQIVLIDELSRLAETVSVNFSQICRVLALNAPTSLYNRAEGYHGEGDLLQDLRSLAWQGRQAGTPLLLAEAGILSSRAHWRAVAQKIVRKLGGIRGKTLSVLGFYRRPGTGETDDSPAVAIAHLLWGAGAVLRCHDPALMEAAQGMLGAACCICLPDVYETAREADAVLLWEDWSLFGEVDFGKLVQNMRGSDLFDMQNTLEREKAVQAGFTYIGLGRPERGMIE